MGNEWQVVQPKARSKSGKGKGSTNNLANGGVKEAGDVALAKLDADWNSKGKNDKPNGTSTSSAFNSLEVDPSPPPSPKSQPSTSAAKEEAPKKVQKPKKPKVKKITTSDIAQGLAGEDFKMVLNDFEERYGNDEIAQLERVADYFLGSFKEADIPFNKTVLEQPITQASEVPVQDLSREVIELAIGFFRRKQSKNLAQCALSLTKVFLSEIPETHSSKATPKKAKVGLLITLSLIFRSRPEILISLSEEFLNSASQFSAPGRLPFQLWVIQQAASSKLGVGISFWCRVLLPQIFGQELPSILPSKSNSKQIHSLGPSQVDVALKYAEECLIESEKSMSHPPKSRRLGPNSGDTKSLNAVQLTENALLESADAGLEVEESGREPVVPSGVLELIASKCYASPPAIQSISTRNRLLKIHSALKDLYLMGVWKGHNKANDAVRLLLDLASVEEPSISGESNELAEQSANLMIDLIHADPKGTTTSWEQRHKHQIKGSSAILQHLATFPTELKTLVKNDLRRQLVLDTLRHLKDRHRGLLATGKSWQQNAARSAENSLQELTQKIISQKRRNTAVNSSLAAAIIFLILLFLLRQDFIQDLVSRLRSSSSTFERVLKRVEGSLDYTQEYILQISRSTVQPALASIKDWGKDEFDKKLRPHVGDIANSALEQIHTLIQKATSILQQK